MRLLYRHIICSIFMVATVFAYDPPIGIPAPTEPAIDSTAGSYTHYVDMDHGSATDVGNANGSPSKPRKTVPTSLSAGDVVEIYNGNYGNSTFTSIAGTAGSPIYIRGGDTDNPAVIDGEWIIQGASSYVIFENLDFDGGGAGGDTVFQITGTCHHITFRNCKVHNRGVANGVSGISIIPTNNINDSVHDIVVYNCNVYDLGNWRDTGDNDYHGVLPSLWGKGGTVSVYNIWILDSRFSYISGDAVQVLGDQSGSGTSNNEDNMHHIYIGRNKSHHNRQAHFWTKESSHCIISQNDCKAGYAPPYPSTQEPAGLGYQYNPDNLWIIFNKVEDCCWGVKASEQATPDGDHNIYVIGNIICDSYQDTRFDHWGEPNGYGMSFWYSNGQTVYIIGNTIKNCHGGIEFRNAPKQAHIYNNIFYEIIDEGTIEMELAATAANVDCNYNLYYDSVNLNIKWAVDWYNLHSVSAFNTATGEEANGVEGDPSFESTAGNLMTLSSGSPAIGAGLSSSVVQTVFDTFQTNYGIDISTVDFYNQPISGAREIGACEYHSGYAF